MLLFQGVNDILTWENCLHKTTSAEQSHGGSWVSSSVVVIPSSHWQLALSFPPLGSLYEDELIGYEIKIIMSSNLNVCHGRADANSCYQKAFVVN